MSLEVEIPRLYSDPSEAEIPHSESSIFDSSESESFSFFTYAYIRVSFELNFKLMVLHTWTYVSIPNYSVSILLLSKPKGYKQFCSNKYVIPPYTFFHFGFTWLSCFIGYLYLDLCFWNGQFVFNISKDNINGKIVTISIPSMNMFLKKFKISKSRLCFHLCLTCYL